MKSKIYSLLCLAMLSSIVVSKLTAQNLVPNPSFEEFTKLPDGDGKFQGYIVSWENTTVGPGGYPAGTPDFLHMKGKEGGSIKEEKFSKLEPHTGKGVVGISAYNSYSNDENYREYITVPLTSTLEVGKNYRVTFWVTNGKKPTYCNKVCNGFGVAITTSKPTQKKGELLPLVAAYSFEEGFKNTNWVQIKFDYQPKSAGERWLTVGNFLDDANTVREKVYDNDGDCAYYFVDDFNVYQTDERLADTSQKAGGGKEAGLLNKKLKQHKTIDRLVNSTADILVDKDSFQCEIWDHREEDGDTISLFMNNKWVIEKHPLMNRKTTVWIKLLQGQENTLILYAHNLGKVPPNTAALRPLIGNRKEYILSSNMKKSQAIHFVKKE